MGREKKVKGIIHVSFDFNLIDMICDRIVKTRSGISIT